MIPVNMLLWALTGDVFIIIFTFIIAFSLKLVWLMWIGLGILISLIMALVWLAYIIYKGL